MSKYLGWIVAVVVCVLCAGALRQKDDAMVAQRKALSEMMADLQIAVTLARADAYIAYCADWIEVHDRIQPTEKQTDGGINETR